GLLSESQADVLRAQSIQSIEQIARVESNRDLAALDNRFQCFRSLGIVSLAGIKHYFTLAECESDRGVSLRYKRDSSSCLYQVGRLDNRSDWRLVGEQAAH